MIRTPICELLGIEHPIIQGPLGGPWPPGVELAAAVANAGALGSLPTALRTPDQVREDVAALRALTDRPFAVNHTFRPFDEGVFSAVLESAPPVVSMALGPAGDLPRRVHDAGSRYLHQVHTVDQAREAAEAGADALIAQGGEAGGFGGASATMVLVPQVVDAVRPLPVVAAGGIADGRGLAAALVLGAAGVNVGTRFLASVESGVPQDYKTLVVQARSEQTIRAPFINHLVPPASPTAFGGSPRVVRTDFVDRWLGRDEELAQALDEVRAEVRAAMMDGRGHELLPIVGETVGLVGDIRPAAEIVRLMVEEAEVILGSAAELVS